MELRSELNFLFWNLGRNNRDGLLSECVRELSIDVVLLAENGSEQDTTLSRLQENVSKDFFLPYANTNRLHVFSKQRELGLKEVYGTANGRTTIRRLSLAGLDFLLGTIHLPSQMNWTTDDLQTEATMVANEIRRLEDRFGHRRTILIGDFNMNPFDTGMASAAALNASSTKSVASAKLRTVQGTEYPYFYNPMWNFLGDKTPGPPGTFYYRHSGHVSYDWNILDHVLIRPDALECLREDVTIHTTIGDTDLADRSGRPRKDIGSDHFPLHLSLKNVKDSDVTSLA